MRLGFNPPSQEKNWLVVIMIAGLINGLLHTFLIPPWQHYDEPGHFEFAWLIANKPGLPVPGEYDQSMRREVAASMVEYNFFSNKGSHPNLLSIGEPVWIGISQTDDVPIYYWLVAIPLSIIRYSDITFQLYIGRLVSLCLFIVTIFGAYAFTSELTKPGNPLRQLIPITIVAIPGFANIMTAVNNDVGAAAFFTLFLWVSVRTIRRGISLLNIGTMILLSIVCILTKSTTFFVIPLAIIAIGLAILSPCKRIYLWLVASLIGFMLFILLLQFDAAAFWHNQTSTQYIKRVKSDQSPIGEYSMKLYFPQGGGASGVNQIIPVDIIHSLDNKTMTIGAWIWATMPTQARTPTIYNGLNNEYQIIDVDTTPRFFVYSTAFKEQGNLLSIKLELDRQSEESEVSIFYDGVIVVEGDFTSKGLPVLNDIDVSEVRWGNESSVNYVRNASFEIAAPRVRWNVEKLLVSYLPVPLSDVLSSIMDLKGYRDYYFSSAQHLFRTFWAVFGWGQVYLVGSKPYRFLLIITMVAMLGDTIYIFRKRHELDVHILVFLSIAFFGVWGMAMTRGVSTVFSNVFIPAARYAYPVIVPTVLLLVIGWREILSSLGTWFHIQKKYLCSAYFFFLIILNVISLYSILQFYGAM